MYAIIGILGLFPVPKFRLYTSLYYMNNDCEYQRFHDAIIFRIGSTFYIL